MSSKCEADKVFTHDDTSDVHDDCETSSKSDSAADVAVSAVQCHSKCVLSDSSL